MIAAHRNLRRWMRALRGALLATLVLVPTAAGAQDAGAAPDFRTWLAALRNEARGQGIAPTTLDAALNGIEPIPRVIELDRRQPEFTQTFWGYMDGRINNQRVERGRDLMKQHAALLKRIEREYGVQDRFLVAFWALESNFGDFTGGFPVIGSLATLAYDPRRSDFFRQELLTALKIVDAGHISAQRMSGSWAGAMGQCQFMPSTFMRYGKDGDGDGRIDLWNSLPDVFTSAANFLAKSGWNGQETWGREARLPANFDLDLVGLEVRRPLAEWQRLGVRRIDGGDLPQADLHASVVLPAGYRGPAFLVYGNFRATLVWNRSINYAISVGHLADRFAWQPPLATQRPADDVPMTRDQVIELQEQLARLGFYAGSTDGIAGSGTREALRAFQRHRGLPSDGYPSPQMLDALRRSNGAGAAQPEKSAGTMPTLPKARM